MSNPGGKLSRQPSEQTILRDYERRIKLLEGELAKTIVGLGSLVGGGGSITPFIYSISIPVTSYTIVHNLNRFVFVQLYDPTGDLMDVSVNCSNPNEAVLSGVVPFSGTAIVI